MMQFFKLVARNSLPNRLRSALTVAGIVAAILAFGLLQTIVEAWFAGVDGAVASRLITRNSISFSSPLPRAYEKRIREVDGVRDVTFVTWFGGIYKDAKNFFPQYAVDSASYFRMYPENVVPEDVLREFQHDRRGAIIGRKLANRFGLKPGDVVQLEGTIYPGPWEFVVKGIFDGRDPKIDTTQLFFRWDYLNETLRMRSKAQAEQVGVFVVDVADVNRVAEVSEAIDHTFRNSFAETRTETERAFQIGFMKQTESILISIRVVSFVVIFIILSVMANTMAMTARERLAEYATLKVLGFGPGYVASLILAESVVLALVGAAVAIWLTPLVAAQIAVLTKALFPTLVVSKDTVALQAVAALTVGVLSAVFPMWRASRVNIIEGLRAVG
jgi:putative ABC transport system permease protein